MSRGFLVGAGWGTVVAGLGLVVASQVSDVAPGSMGIAPPTAEVSTEVLVAPSGPDQAVVERGSVQEPATPKADDLAVAPDRPQDDAPDMAALQGGDAMMPAVPTAESGLTPEPTPEGMASDSLANPPEAELASPPVAAPQTTIAAPDMAATAVDTPPAPAVSEAADVATSRNTMGLPDSTLADLPPVMDLELPLPVSEGIETATEMEPSETPVEVPDVMPADTAETGIVPDATPSEAPQTDQTAEAATENRAEDPVARPAPGFGGSVDGVRTGRLPSIAPAAEAVADVDAAAPTIEPEVVAVADDPSLPAIDRFAREFENTAGKPLFAVLLQDVGGPEVDREALAAIPFPVSFVIDPTLPDAATAARIYRAAGQEVLMLASGLPSGANASDISVSLEAMAAVLPESVALVDLENGGFQGNRTLATQVLAVVADQGRGVISWDRGLNAASQVARREGIRNALVFRALDGGEESSPVIRRYLDRAAFKAAQDGRVVVSGTTRPETVAALLEWAVEGRAATVALAPATAVMTGQ